MTIVKSVSDVCQLRTAVREFVRNDLIAHCATLTIGTLSGIQICILLKIEKVMNLKLLEDSEPYHSHPVTASSIKSISEFDSISVIYVVSRELIALN